MDAPFLILGVAYGTQIRRIFAARIQDAGEMDEAENEFWSKVVQRSGEYAGKAPVEHWLTKIAKNQARNALRSQVRRTKWVAYRAEMASKMRDAEEYADEQVLTPGEILAQEELAKEAHQVVTTFLGSLDAETAEAVVRNKVEGNHF